MSSETVKSSEARVWTSLTLKLSRRRVDSAYQKLASRLHYAEMDFASILWEVRGSSNTPTFSCQTNKQKCLTSRHLFVAVPFLCNVTSTHEEKTKTRSILELDLNIQSVIEDKRSMQSRFGQWAFLIIRIWPMTSTSRLIELVIKNNNKKFRRGR